MSATGPKAAIARLPEFRTEFATTSEIRAQRAQLLQAHGVLRCLCEVLLHAECDDAVFYAEAAHVAANLINITAEEPDSVHRC
jgi:hypothetical protein